MVICLVKLYKKKTEMIFHLCFCFVMLEKRAKETSIFGLCKFYIAFSRRRKGTALAVDEAHCNVGEGYANA